MSKEQLDQIWNDFDWQTLIFKYSKEGKQEDEIKKMHFEDKITFGMYERLNGSQWFNMYVYKDWRVYGKKS